MHSLTAQGAAQAADRRDARHERRGSAAHDGAASVTNDSMRLPGNETHVSDGLTSDAASAMSDSMRLNGHGMNASDSMQSPEHEPNADMAGLAGGKACSPKMNMDDETNADASGAVSGRMGSPDDEPHASAELPAEAGADIDIENAHSANVSAAPAEDSAELGGKDASHTKRRRGLMSRWWRMGRARSTQHEAESQSSDAEELEEISRRVRSELDTARERIESGISATAPTPDELRAAEEALRAERAPRRDKWQSEDNAFNEMSRAVHAKASDAVHNFRFSMATRISWNYARMLLETLVIVLLVMTALLVMVVIPRLDAVSADAANQLRQAAHAQEGGLSALPVPSATPAPPAEMAVTSPPQEGGAASARRPRAQIRQIEMRLDTQDAAYACVIGSDGRVYFDDAPFDLNKASLLSYFGGEFYRVDSDLISVDGSVYQLHVAVSLSYWLKMALIMMGGLMAVDMLRSAYFLTQGRRANAQILRPIAAMSDTARHLNAQNMSERINVEGTKSELRELALVINDMLDRIEAAYDGQKQFVSDASHELRTPIAVIQGYASMLERWGKDDAAVRDEAIAAINHEAANMKELVEKLLFLARHDKQTLRMKSEVVDLRAMAEDAVRETRMIVSDREIVSGDMQDARALGDSAALKQALRIFIDNACKYTPPGGKVTISCKLEGNSAHLSVADTGCGIPADDLKRVFDRFYRVDDSRGEVPGHGLGLSIARIIAQSHGGRIHVRSREGQGSVFTLELPGMGG